MKSSNNLNSRDDLNSCSSIQSNETRTKNPSCIKAGIKRYYNKNNKNSESLIIEYESDKLKIKPTCSSKAKLETDLISQIMKEQELKQEQEKKQLKKESKISNDNFASDMNYIEEMIRQQNQTLNEKKQL